MSAPDPSHFSVFVQVGRDVAIGISHHNAVQSGSDRCQWSASTIGVTGKTSIMLASSDTVIMSVVLDVIRRETVTVMLYMPGTWRHHHQQIMITVSSVLPLSAVPMIAVLASVLIFRICRDFPGQLQPCCRNAVAHCVGGFGADEEGVLQGQGPQPLSGSSLFPCFVVESSDLRITSVFQFNHRRCDIRLRSGLRTHCMVGIIALCERMRWHCPRQHHPHA